MGGTALKIGIFVVLLLVSTHAAQAASTASGNEIKSTIIALLWWPSDPAPSLSAFVREIDRCLTREISRSSSVSGIVSSSTVQQLLYPLMEPGTQPASEEQFAKMLQREDVRARLNASGLDYLVAVTGGTRVQDWKGGIFCGAGYGGGGCLGFAWANKTTQLDAVLWDLSTDVKLDHAAARDEGTSVAPAFILPIVIPARTQSGACRKLGRNIVELVEKNLGKVRD